MVNKTVFIALSAFFISLFSAVFLHAGEFTASVSSTKMRLGDSFSLSLTLKDISPTEAPVVTALKQHFSLNSQQNSTSTSIINGKVSSSIIWKLSLTPKIEGVIDIPSITVKTAEGFLSTQPITLNVVQDSTPQTGVDNVGLSIVTDVSNAVPYKNEPLIYTAILTSKMPLYNIQTQKMQMDDVIVELLGEPELKERVIGGVLLNIVEFNYLITPLKTGSLTIPPIAIHGAIPQKSKGQTGSFFSDDFDPFAFIQGFDRLKSFTLMTEEIQLDVQPTIAEVSPWLPAKALTLEEMWPNDQALRVGEPFSRGFLINAEGVKASQLHLEDLQASSSTFKVYADKPEEQEKMVQDSIHSMRKEHYTLIPQQAGTWVLPEISISWWDTIKKAKRTSTIPARTVQILPATEIATASAPQDIASNNTPTVATEASSVRLPMLLYGIIGILTLFLTVALLWGFRLQRKIASLTKDKKSPSPPVKAIQKEKKEKLPDLNPT